MICQRLTEFPSNGGDYQAHVMTYGALPQVHPQQWLQMVIDSGLRGRGGGWFPTGHKLQTVIRESKLHHRRPVVVCNAMEGEPDSVGDAAMLRAHPQLVIDGIQAAARIVGARKAFLALHDTAQEVDLLRSALSQRPAGEVPLELVLAPARYVASEESALARFISGGDARPVFGRRPYEHGVRGRPTVVNNAETLAHLALILRRGPQWFRQVGTAEAPGTTLVSVGGDVAASRVIEVEIGTPISAMIEGVGGVEGALTGARVGGFGGAWTGTQIASLTWDPDALRAAGLRAGAGILSILSDRHCAIVESARTLDYLAGESAGQCGVCTFGLSDTSKTMTQLANMQADLQAVDDLTRRLASIPRRGGCGLPDGAADMAQSALRVFADEARSHLAGTCAAHSALTPWQNLPPVQSHPVVAPGRHFQ